MPEFVRNFTLREKLNTMNKDTLKSHASALGLSRLSKLKKAELVDLVVSHLLDPEVFYYRTAILSNTQVSLLESAMDGPASYKSFEEDSIIDLMDMDLVELGDNEYVTFYDVAELWKKIKTPEFEDYRKRASWVWKCMYFAEDFYAYTPIDDMLNLINIKIHMNMTSDELNEIYEHFPMDQCWMERVSDVFIGSKYLENLENLEEIHHEQGNKPYYIPSVAEVDEYFETSALLSSKAYQDMLHFAEINSDLDLEDIEDVLIDAWDMIASYSDYKGAIQMMIDELEPESEWQVRKIIDLGMAMMNDTRMLVNRGHKPGELRAKSVSKQSDAGVHFNQANVQPVVAEKKIYPNDPCPCGSGKKYKKCCGKGK